MKTSKLSALILVGLLIGSILSGCGISTTSIEDTENYQNFIAVVGNHAGSLKPTYSTCERAVMGACKAEGSVAIIVADGDPYLATGDYIDIPEQQTNLSASKLKQIYTSQTEQILTLMETSYAQTEEVDLLKALTLCAREAQSSQFDEGNTEIYIYDSGVSTKFLNMTLMDLECLDADAVVSILEEKNMIPNLSGVGTIHWFNIGDVDYEISNAQIEGMKKVWTAIIEAAGAQVKFYTDPSTEKFDVELPYVSEIPYTVDAIEVGTTVEELDVPIVFTESEIGFEPGAITFSDQNQASETLSKVTNYLLENEEIDILIAATTADWGTMEYQTELSERRAAAIEKYFVDAGIDESRLSTIGLGSTSGFYKYDHNSDGELNEDIASKNRSIVIMDSSGERAVEILAGNFTRGEMYDE